jgi:membrane protein implicated in regulation of membrane protease activity
MNFVYAGQTKLMVLSWWLWLLLGGLLFLLELLTPGGFFLFFFGVGALIVALLAAIGLSGPAWTQWLLFGAISTVAFSLFRKPLQRRLATKHGHEVDSMIGETAVALADIGIGGIGKAELRGSVWGARNSGESTILTGQRCRVERVEGLMLCIRG